MKKVISIVIFALIGGLKLYAIDTDSLEMKSGYSEQVFYSLKNGVVQNASTKWDLAFEVSGFGSGIRINEGFGNVIYTYPKGTKSAWTSVDTSGFASWKVIHNSEKEWSIGALNQYPANDYDLGWGVYNPITHVVEGDSIFILKTTKSIYKKLLIEKLASGSYTIKYADLDGQNEKSVNIKKSDYNTKNFVYFSFETESILDLEPSKESWDLVFTKYSAEIQSNVNYVVTGVLLNNGVKAYKDSKVSNPFTHTLDTSLYQSDMNTIGYNWKSFNGSSFVIEDSIVFFLQDKNAKNWRFVFTRFDGSATGKVVLNKQEEVLSALENSVARTQTFRVYPNPSNQNQTIRVELGDSVGESTLEILSLNGNVVYSSSIQNEATLPALEAGMYIVNISNSHTYSQQKLIVH